MRYDGGMDYSLEALGQVIREHREARIPRWTQHDLGKAAGYKSGAAVSISRIESGLMRPGPERLAGIAHALEMRVDLLEEEAVSRTLALSRDRGASQTRRTSAGGERIRDRAVRIQREVERRRALITELGDAFNAAHDRARDEFLMNFVEVAAGIKDAPEPPQPEPIDNKDDEATDAYAEVSYRIRLTSHGVARALAGGAGGAFAGGAVGGVAAYGAFIAAVSLGTASTGAAIAGLSGVAATNAALALLGGGTLAAGGAGIAGGATVLAGIVAAPAVLLAVGGLVWMVKRNRKQQQELTAKLDEADAEIAATRPGVEALADLLPRATATLDYIALHAGHALKRWRIRLGALPLEWSSMSPEDQQQYDEFIEICANQLSLVTINFTDVMVSRGEQRDALIKFADEVVKQAQFRVESLV